MVIIEKKFTSNSTMAKQIFIHCFLISLVASLIIPVFTFSVFIPEEGDTVYDFTEIDQEKMKNLPHDEVSKYVDQNLKTREISGFERFTYPFKQPHILLVYLKASMAMFLPIFGATVATSALNLRSHNKLKKQ